MIEFKLIFFLLPLINKRLRQIEYIHSMPVLRFVSHRFMLFESQNNMIIVPIGLLSLNNILAVNSVTFKI